MGVARRTVDRPRAGACVHRRQGRRGRLHDRARVRLLAGQARAAPRLADRPRPHGPVAGAGDRRRPIEVRRARPGGPGQSRRLDVLHRAAAAEASRWPTLAGHALHRRLFGRRRGAVGDALPTRGAAPEPGRPCHADARLLERVAPPCRRGGGRRAGGGTLAGRPDRGAVHGRGRSGGGRRRDRPPRSGAAARRRGGGGRPLRRRLRQPCPGGRARLAERRGAVTAVVAPFPGARASRGRGERWSLTETGAFVAAVFMLLTYSQGWQLPLVGGGDETAHSELLRNLFLPAYAAGVFLAALTPLNLARGLVRQPFLIVLVAVAAL